MKTSLRRILAYVVPLLMAGVLLAGCESACEIGIDSACPDPDTTPPGPVSPFDATPGDRQVTLNWGNPVDQDYQGVIIQRGTEDFPESINEGDRVTCVGRDTIFYVDSGLTRGTTYYYSAFSKDTSGNIQPSTDNQPAQVSVTLPDNGTPIADAGSNQEVAVRAIATLDGTDSSDPDGDPLSFNWTLVAPEGSTAELSDSAAVRPTFVADVLGEYIATLVVSDGELESEADSVTITSIAGNQPTADAGSDQTVYVDATVSLDGSASSDPEGNPLTFFWTLETPDGSSAELSENTAAQATFIADVVGNYLATLVVNNGTLNSSPDTVTISSTVPPNLPVAEDDSITTNEDTAVSFSLYASDLDGDQLTYTILTEPSAGTVNCDFTGYCTYTPDQHSNGEDSFTFKVNDGRDDSNTSTVTISVAPLNDPPTAVSLSITAEENGSSSSTPPTVSDVDLSNEGDTYTLVKLSEPTNGTAEVTGDNELIYTPNLWFNGSDSLSIRVIDQGGESVDGLASVTVEDTTPPEAVGDFTATASDGQVSLSWTNPGTFDFVEVIVRRDATGFPASPVDGEPVYQGAGSAVEDGGHTNGDVIYYSAFALDEKSNYSKSEVIPLWPTWMTVATGYTHYLAIKTDGTLYAWGMNDAGQLGLGNTTNQSTPTRVGTDMDWASVAAGERFSLGVKADGSLYAWGVDSGGTLGTGDCGADEYSPRRVGLDSDWESIAAGSDHVLAIKTDGTLYTWGRNDKGQLGQGTSVDRICIPTYFNHQNINTVAAGHDHSLANSNIGWIDAAGYNNHGQLGDPAACCDDQEDFIEVGGSSATADYVAVAAGSFFSLAIKDDGSIWGWGDNSEFQLADTDTDDKIEPELVDDSRVWVVIAAGESHSLAIASDGRLWAWGNNGSGQLGIGSNDPSPNPEMVGNRTDWQFVVARENYSFGTTGDGCLWWWGSGSGNVPTLVSCF